MSAGDEDQVVVIGPSYCDVAFAGLPRIPALGEEITTDRVAVNPGCLAITAVALARLRIRTAFISAVGDDLLGHMLPDRLRAEGVDVTNVQVVPGGRTGISAAISLLRDHCFLTFEGVNLQWPKFLLDAPKILRRLSGYRHVHTGVPTEGGPALRALATAVHDTGATLSLDIGWAAAERWTPQRFADIAGADILLPNEREGLRITGASTPEEALRTMQTYVRLPVMKLGARGAITLKNNEVVAVPAVPVDVVDTVGAGDAFGAGFLLGWLAGQPLTRCLQMGNVCGAYSARAAGGMDALPTLVDLMKALEPIER